MGDSYTLFFESTSSVEGKVSNTLQQQHSSPSNTSAEDSILRNKEIYFPVFIINYVKMFFYCMFQKSGTEFLPFVYLIFLATHKSLNLIAEFGVALCLINICNAVLTKSNLEIMLSDARKYFIEKKYRMMRLTFFRGLLMSYIIFFFSFIVFIRIDLLLEVLGFRKDIYCSAHYLILTMLPTLFIKCYNECLYAYLQAMNFKKTFLCLNLMDQLLTIVLSYGLVVHFRFKLLGFSITYLFVESFNFMFLSILWAKKGIKESRSMESLKDVIKMTETSNQTFRDYSKNVSANSATFLYVIGNELQVIIIAMNKDIEILTVWVCIMILTSVIQFLGELFAMVTKIYCSSKLFKNPNIPKKIAWIGVTSSMILGVFFSLIFICMNYQFAKIFIDSTNVTYDWLEFYIQIYGCAAWQHIIQPQLRMLCILTSNKKILIFCQATNDIFITSIINISSYQFAAIGRSFIIYSKMYALGMTAFIELIYQFCLFQWDTLAKTANKTSFLNKSNPSQKNIKVNPSQKNIKLTTPEKAIKKKAAIQINGNKNSSKKTPKKGILVKSTKNIPNCNNVFVNNE